MQYTHIYWGNTKKTADIRLPMKLYDQEIHTSTDLNVSAMRTGVSMIADNPLNLAIQHQPTPNHALQNQALQNHALQNHALQNHAGIEQKYIRFWIDNHIFAAHIDVISEIIDYTEITEVPNAPDWVRGVMSLRGRVLPVIDIAVKLGFQKREKKSRTCFLIIDFLVEEISIRAALIVDAVRDVMTIPLHRLEPPPRFGAGFDLTYITGFYQIPDSKDYLKVVDFIKIFAKDALFEGLIEEKRAQKAAEQRKEAEMRAAIAEKKRLKEERRSKNQIFDRIHTQNIAASLDAKELEEGVFVFE